MTNYVYVMDFWDSFNWDLYIKFLNAKNKKYEDELEKKYLQQKIENEKNQKDKKDKKQQVLLIVTSVKIAIKVIRIIYQNIYKNN